MYYVLDKVKQYFTESIQTKIAATEALLQSLCYAVTLLVQVLTNGHKILCCGNGSFSANALAFCQQYDRSVRNRTP